jgi:hypothetical protein
MCTSFAVASLLLLLVAKPTFGASVNCTALGYTTIGRGYYFRFNAAYISWGNSRLACQADVPGYSDMAILKDPSNFNLVHTWWLSLLAAGKSAYNWVGLRKNDTTYWGSVDWFWLDGTPMSGDGVWPEFRNWSTNGGWPDIAREVALFYTGYQPGLVTYPEAAGAATTFCAVPSKFLTSF